MSSATVCLVYSMLKCWINWIGTLSPTTLMTTKSVVPESVASDMSKATQYPDPDITARARRAFNTFVANDFPPGPKFLPMFVMINLQKGGTLPFCLALMMYYENWSAPCLLYTASHGTYGIVWLLKHVAFRDAGWDTRQTFLGAINGFLMSRYPGWAAYRAKTGLLVPWIPSLFVSTEDQKSKIN